MTAYPRISMIIAIPVTLIILAGVIALQIYLSKRKHFLPGLILPALYLFMIVPTVLAILLFTARTAVSSTTVNSNSLSVVAINVPAVIMTVIFTVAPFIAMLVIYFICRARIKKRKEPALQSKEINKMNIQDL